MEFKDKLKKLRTEKGLSQQALADAIFVSRSAVAKWENGLGVPRGETFDALLDYFGVTKEEFITEEPEEVILEKNRSIHRLTLILRGCGTVLLIAVSILLPVLIMSGKWGFVSEMAAGNFADNSCIHTKDYDIYYGCPETIIDGRSIEYIEFFRPVKKVFLGYYVFEEDYRYRELFSGGEVIGHIYSLKGRDCYYHIIKKSLSNKMLNTLLEFDSVTVDGVEHPVQVNSFFVTEEPLKQFYIGELSVTVGNTLMWREPIK